MKSRLTARVSKEFGASPSEVWKALTDPVEIKKYFFGTNVISDWKAGSKIVFKGEWEGKTYEDKGIIKELIPEKKLEYTFFSSFSGKEDVPENYANVCYVLTPKGNGTHLEISQDSIETEERKKESESNWNMILEELDKLVSTKA